MKFTPIDFNKWPRNQIFYYFSKMAPTGYSITVNVNVTHLKAICNDRKIKFFPAYLWLVTKNLNRFPEFKTAEKDGLLGFYDTLTPLYANFHDDDKTFSLMWTEYNENFINFYNTYIENHKLYSSNHGILSQPLTPPPENAYTVSCIPWISFHHFAVHSFENKPYYFPSVEAGKYYEDKGKLIMPVSITCHHATTDGYHIKCFLDNLQNDMDNFEKYI